MSAEAPVRKPARAKKAATSPVEAPESDQHPEAGSEAKSPPKKRTAKRKAAPIIVLRTEVTSIDELSEFYKNPNVGDLPRIMDSLKHNGQFRAILVNIGTKTGRENEVLAGNHTFIAAKRLGWQELLVSFVDVDETTARRIVIADNESHKGSTRKDDVMADLIAGLPKVDGLAMPRSEIDEITEKARKASAEAAVASGASLTDFLATIPERLPDSEKPAPRPTVQDYADKESEDAKEAAAMRGARRMAAEEEPPKIETEEDTDAALDKLSDARAEIQGALELREQETWRGDNYWDIPVLREDMLLESVPVDIQCWAGAQLTPDDGVSTYMWNYGLGTLKGLPYDRALLSFYAFDDKFEGFWQFPAYFLSKVLAQGVSMACTPDFSMYHEGARFTHLQGHYQRQWCGRFFQESGLKVIPTIELADEKDLDFGLEGIPKGAPIITFQAQNYKGMTNPPPGTKEQIKEFMYQRRKKLIQTAIDTIRPENQVMLYGGAFAQRMLGELDLKGAEPVFVESYSTIRNRALDEARKAIPSSAQRKKIREAAKRKAAEHLGIDINATFSGPQSDEDDDDVSD